MIEVEAVIVGQLAVYPDDAAFTISVDADDGIGHYIFKGITDREAAIRAARLLDADIDFAPLVATPFDERLKCLTDQQRALLRAVHDRLESASA